MPISSPGLGSGLDVTSIVSQLVELERRPIVQLQERKAKFTTQLSSIGLLQSYMANVQSAAGQLGKSDWWTKNVASSSEPTAVSVSASPGATPASHSIEVLSLATAHSLSTAAGAITNAADMGAGTLTLTRGASSVNLTIVAGTSLAGVRDQINAAEAGMTASIVMDAGNPRLVVTSTDTGAANSIGIAVSGKRGQLTALAYPGSMGQDRAAADAVLKINGLQITSASNKLSGVVEGMTLTLSKVTTAPVQVSVGNDIAGMRKGVTDFVSAFNEIAKYLASQTRFDDATKAAGALQGDRSAVGLQNRLRALVQQSSSASTRLDRLGDIGLELQRDGTLKVDNAKLDATLADPAEMSRAFATLQSGFGQRFKLLADSVLGNDGLLTTRSNGLRDAIARNDKDQQRLLERIGRVQERLTRQYAALDTSINRLNGLDSYVKQQITNWNRDNR